MTFSPKLFIELYTGVSNLSSSFSVLGCLMYIVNTRGEYIYNESIFLTAKLSTLWLFSFYQLYMTYFLENLEIFVLFWFFLLPAPPEAVASRPEGGWQLADSIVSSGFWRMRISHNFVAFAGVCMHRLSDNHLRLSDNHKVAWFCFH